MDRDPLDDVPEPRLDPAEEEAERRFGRTMREIVRQLHPSPPLGYATEHSIEDPFTGEITVTFRAF